MLRRICSVTATLVAIIIIVSPLAAFAGTSRTFDIVIYGATPGGVMAAIQAERLGKSVAIVEPSDHIGGMVTGGLSATDRGSNPAVIGGLAREFFSRVGSYYGVPDGWYFEPKVASQIMNQMLSEAGVSVYLNQQIAEGAGGVIKSKTTQLKSLVTVDGNVYTAKQFIDASYEGDLMADAGVSYTTGREAASQYNESVAGVQPVRPFSPGMSAYDGNGNLYPQVTTEKLGALGSADNHVQSYNFRFTSTNVAANRIPYPKPLNYDPAQYSLLAAWLPKLQASLGRNLVAGDLLKYTPLPNGKFDTNNVGPFSTDFQNGSTGYPNGTYAQRALIYQQTKDYDMGLVYFLQNDPSVPMSLHNDMAQYGLPKDESTDSGNWPSQLYVREARRMVGAYVLKQQDLQQNKTKSTVIALSSYVVDQHNSYRGIDTNGQAVNEGGMYVKTAAVYAIPYTIITPQSSQVTNLLVTGTPSASHVAWSSLRMEPQFMMLGQAAGDAASIAIDNNVKVQSVPYASLKDLLNSQGAILNSNQVSTTIVDNSQTGSFQSNGNWMMKPAITGVYGANYLQSEAQDLKTATWTPYLPLNGKYALYARLPVNNNLSTSVSFAVTYGGQTVNAVVSQQTNNGKVYIGTFPLQAGPGVSVQLITNNSSDTVAADAIEFTKV